MSSTFGTFPYRACFYGDAEEQIPLVGDGSAADKLKAVLQQCKSGDFSNVDTLASLMTDDCYDVRQYSCQLYAHVCDHDQVSSFMQAFRAATDGIEIARVIVRLGETLSLRAIPLLINIHEEYPDEDLDHYVLMALRNILSPAELPADRSAADLISSIAAAPPQLDLSTYWYRGCPVFVGDVTKELVQAALIANRERRPIILVRQAQILSNFSGIECPAMYGQAITDKDVEAVFDYVESLARFEWKRGVKYFYRHEII